MSSVTGTVVSSPCITMPSESPTRITSQYLSTMPRGVRVIRGQADDRLAALAGENVGRGEPLDFVLRRT